MKTPQKCIMPILLSSCTKPCKMFVQMSLTFVQAQAPIHLTLEEHTIRFLQLYPHLKMYFTVKWTEDIFRRALRYAYAQ